MRSLIHFTCAFVLLASGSAGSDRSQDERDAKTIRNQSDLAPSDVDESTRLRGVNVYCWFATGPRGERGFESFGPSGISYVSPLSSQPAATIEQLATFIAAHYQDPTIIPKFPGASNTRPFKVRGLSSNEQRRLVELLAAIEAIRKKDAGETEKKTAEPGATDNPDDAQRLREDH